MTSPPPPHKAPLEKLHGCSTVAARAFRPSRQESQTTQRRPHGPDIDSSPQSCNAQSLYPLVHFISLSLRPFLAPCACSVSALLQFSSELHCQSCNAQSLCPPLGMNSDCLKTTPILLGKAASVITPAIISLNHVSRFTVLRNLRFGHCTSSTKNELRERQTHWTNKSRRLCSVARCTDSFTADSVILYFVRQ